jgi:hypothetical protein
MFVALAATPGASLFAGVIYDFSGVVSMFGTKQIFRYTAQQFVTTDTFVPAAALDLCTSGGLAPCFGVNFLGSGPDTTQHYPELTFQTLNPGGSLGTTFYYFPLDVSFAKFGSLSTVSSLGNTGTLTIAPIPEPATGLMLMGGLIVAGFSSLLRRKPIPGASAALCE